jgi:hypothetical protein
VRLYLLLLERELFLEVTEARSFFQARPLARFEFFAMSVNLLSKAFISTPPFY